LSFIFFDDDVDEDLKTKLRNKLINKFNLSADDQNKLTLLSNWKVLLEIRGIYGKRSRRIEYGPLPIYEASLSNDTYQVMSMFVFEKYKIDNFICIFAEV